MSALEEPLAGGMGNAGAVVRVGDTVRRPVKSSSAAVQALLVHLEGVGFDDAPRYLGVDDKGREVVSFIEGEVPLPPYPAWCLTGEALDGVARLLRHFHDATASFDTSSASGWALEFADPEGGPVICHNDVFPENVVFRSGEPVAFIDFDLAAPGQRLWDVSLTLHEWAPLHAPEARHRHPAHLDGVARVGRFARAYGVDPDEATDLGEIVIASRRQVLAHIRSEIARGTQVWIDDWRETRGEERAAADDAWHEANREAMVAAVAGSN